jgi:hypothetical protein
MTSRRKDAFDCGDGKHQVVTIEATGRDALWHRRQPCAECPWRKDAPLKAFPASAYRHSARTSYDMGQSVFACHMSGAEKSATCAGFLLVGAQHNMLVRLAMLDGRYDPGAVSANGVALYESYRQMAIANGVDPDDPALAPCRGVDEDWSKLRRMNRHEKTEDDARRGQPLDRRDEGKGQGGDRR